MESLILGVKKTTGNPHWYLRIGDTVINSEDGSIQNASDYEAREIDLVLAAFIVPLNSPGRIESSAQ